jgi:flagellin-specific chaperone FliS
MKYSTNPPAEFIRDQQWTSDLADIAGAVHVGVLHIWAGQLKTGHDDLERVRTILNDLRERNNMPEMADKLTTYHRLMESTVLAATTPNDKTAAAEKIKQQLPELKKAWEAIQSFYDSMPAGQVKIGLAESMKMESDTINALETAADTEATLQAAQSLKPPFTRLFLDQAKLAYDTLTSCAPSFG